MAAIVSPWATKPGAWALDSEEHEDELLQQQKSDAAAAAGPPAAAAAPLADFPSLAAAAAVKPKKKKGQAIPLAQFNYGSAAPKYEPSKGLTREDLLMLPTRPRERSAEELDRSRLGGGFKSYGSGRYGSNDSGEDSSNSRWGSSRVSDDSRRQGGFDREGDRESLPSRADEIDDWSAMKKSTVGNGFERRERGGFFSSQSKADDSDSWVSNKSSEPRRFSGEVGRERRVFNRGVFEGSNGGGTDADRWSRRKEDEGSFSSGTDADKWGKRKEDEGSFGSGADADKWGKRKEDEGSFGSGADADKWGKRKEDEGSFGSSRPRLVLQPRTVAVSDGAGSGSGAVAKPKASSPFGNARPREEVLKEKGQDWKEIDEKLDTMKIKEVETGDNREGSFGKRSFGSGIGRANLQDDRTEGIWRKNDSNEVTAVPSPSVEQDDNGVEGN
ncbi:eukaryotic translation initiation factor 4B3 [Syzygium oleosum]|uniref:eukaryotic translation initiation factor 4B3 n=1 Tax=Syzygium oleosum TaxID=219896 RepID=UPI0024BBD0B5|nr:eukaryotic translation initiation factor 4B3 [Syzygium oleosum]